jgi:hypothetical protein
MWEWKNYGENPYAATPEEAVKKLPEALSKLGIPAEHHQAFIELVRTHPKGMQTGHTSLKLDDRLVAMMEGGGGFHRNVIVKFKRGIEATTWEWYHAGIALILPHVCHNWSWREICVELHFNAADGMLVQVYIAAEIPFPMPNHCLAYRQGQGSWQEWRGSCGLANCDYTASIAEVRQVVNNSRLQVHHPLGYKATMVEQTLRFDRTVYQKTVVICLIYDDPVTGQRSWSVMYMPGEDWNERTVVHIDNTLWQWHG